jgi:hypothetical protein
LSATYTEPSAAGGFFAAWSSFLLFIVADLTTARRSDWLLLCTGIAMLLLTTSSTGYVVLTIVLSIFVLQQVVRLVVRGKISPRVAIVCAVIGVGALGALAFLPDFDRLLREVLLQKSESISAKDRTATQWQALSIIGQTSGLGVGLGSNRPSGMVFYILSNLGVPGVALFAYCLYVTLILGRSAVQPLLHCTHIGGYLRGSTWAFAVTLLGLAISGAEVTTPQLWIVWSLMTGIMGHAYASLRRNMASPALGSCVARPLVLVDSLGSG